MNEELNMIELNLFRDEHVRTRLSTDGVASEVMKYVLPYELYNAWIDGCIFLRCLDIPGLLTPETDMSVIKMDGHKVYIDIIDR